MLVSMIQCYQSLQMVLWELLWSLFCWRVASLALQKALKVTVILRSLLVLCALSTLPAQLGKGGIVLKHPGTFLYDSRRHLRQLALLLPCSCLPPSAGDIWAAWLLSSAPAADLTQHCHPLVHSSTPRAATHPLLGHYFNEY